MRPAYTYTMRRNTDPATSHAAATSAAPRTGSQKATLLRAYAIAGDIGLTDEEAASITRLDQRPSCCWWKRCSDLRRDGFIEATGRARAGQAGDRRMVCAITPEGRLAVMGAS